VLLHIYELKCRSYFYNLTHYVVIDPVKSWRGLYFIALDNIWRTVYQIKLGTVINLQFILIRIKKKYDNGDFKIIIFN
jgi:hypothetical protein